MKLKMSKTWLSLVTSLALSLPLVLSCGKTSSSNLDRLAATTVDNTVVKDVLQSLHKANQDEINAGKLAQQKANDPAVKDFAKMLVDDHTKADQQVTDVAKRANVTLGGNESQPSNPAPGAPATGPTQPAAPNAPAPTPAPTQPPAPPSGGTTAPGHTGGGSSLAGAGDPLESLRNLSGQEFDREFLTMQVEDHGMLISQLNGQLPKLGDSETAKLVQQLLPQLQTHLDKAKQLLQRLGGNMTPESGKCAKGQNCQQQQQQQKFEKCGKGQNCQQQQQKEKLEKCTGKNCQQQPPVSPKPPMTPPAQQQQQQGQQGQLSPKPPVTPTSPKPPVPGQQGGEQGRHLH